MSPIIGWQNGARIRELREQRRLKVAQLAKHVGVAPQYLSLVELNRKGTGLDTLVRIARAGPQSARETQLQRAA